MKYTHKAYDEVIAAFDRTIKRAEMSNEPIFFNCLDISSITTKDGRRACPEYCPMWNWYEKDCRSPRLPADRWQMVKEQFIINYEPQDHLPVRQFPNCPGRANRIHQRARCHAVATDEGVQIQ